jgi:hypothetical protein
VVTGFLQLVVITGKTACLDQKKGGEDVARKNKKGRLQEIEF